MGYGITIPFDGMPLHAQRELIASLPDLGYTDVWSAEAGGSDAFTPLALASAWAPKLRLGSAIVPAFTRGAPTIAQSAAALADAAPGRVAIGVGSSSNVIVQKWNGIPFERPYERVRDVVRFLRVALTGAKVTQAYDTFVHEGGPDKEIVARVFLCPTDDVTAARTVAKTAIAGYMTVPVYRAFHEWLGRTDVFGPMWKFWAEGDRKSATASIPDEVADSLVVHGTPEQCRAHIQRYLDNGVTTTAPLLLPVPGQRPEDVAAHVRALAPNQ
jgi:alkanesulfonate monooxygenase SsuD/methylene tetrahydromethanopterin reductase-like flavin-dependent oxidoreductase (luciferase family)